MDEDRPIKSAAQERGVDGKFLPNNIANPKGRPVREHCLSDAIYELLAGDPEVVLAKWKKKTLTGARRAAAAWFKKVNAADMTALKEALDRTEGKVTQPISGEGGGAIPFQIVVNSKEEQKALEEAAKRLG